VPPFHAGARRAAVFPRYRRRLPPPHRAAGPGCRRPAHGTATPRPRETRIRARACTEPDRTPALPRHACATASPCAFTPATRPRPRVRVAAKSLRLFPEHPSGAHTRTRPRRQTYTHTLIYRTGSRPATSDPAEADKWDHPVSTDEKDEDAGPRGGEAEAKSPAPGGEKPACEGFKPSRSPRLASPLPEPQGELPLRA
jgi:hypothetical protein